MTSAILAHRHALSLELPLVPLPAGVSPTAAYLVDHTTRSYYNLVRAAGLAMALVLALS
jgi:hypothetical protein